MLFDINNLFWHTGNVYAFTTGEFVSLAGMTAGSASLNINLGQPRDLGIGDGEFIPKVALYMGSTGITSSCSSLKLNFQFQGSTDSVTWTTYVESGANSTASYAANYKVLPIDVPRIPVGTSLPQYYRINIAETGNANGESVSTGSIIGGLVIQREDNLSGSYPANFTVA